MTTTANRYIEQPSRAELQQLYEQNRTNAEIARMYCVAPSTVRSWRNRLGLPTRRPRYERTIPWRVRAEHTNEYARLMLQVLGARLDGHSRPEKRERELDAWLAKLRGRGLVVAYAPWRTPGFTYIPGEWIDGEIPIQMAEVPPPSEGGGKHRRFEDLEDHI